MKVKFEFVAPLLGTISGNKDVATEFIVAKAAENRNLDVEEIVTIKKEELSTLPAEDIDKSSTLFHRDEEGRPFLYSYMINGFFKAACDAMIDGDGENDIFKKHTKKELKDMKLTRWSYKSTINKLIRVKERRLYLALSGPIDVEERSMRVTTMQGDRVCLARSESAPEGTTIELTIECLNSKLWPYIEEWLGYGIFGGLGQWRSSYFGSFTWERLDAPVKKTRTKLAVS